MPLPPLFGTPCPMEHPLLHPGLSAGGRSDVAPRFHLETPNSFRKINIYRPLLDILIKDPLEFIPSQCCFDITESYKIRMLSQLLRSITEVVSFLPLDEIKGRQLFKAITKHYKTDQNLDNP